MGFWGTMESDLSDMQMWPQETVSHTVIDESLFSDSEELMKDLQDQCYSFSDSDYRGSGLSSVS